MNFSGEHSAQRLRYEQAPKGRRSDASGWASDPADKEPLGWASAPPIGRFWMAVCPADRVPPDRRLPPRSDGFDTHSVPMQTQKGDPVGSPFNSGTDQKNQLKVIVDDPYLYRSSFSFAAS